jgi:hypothetical protein
VHTGIGSARDSHAEGILALAKDRGQSGYELALHGWNAGLHGPTPIVGAVIGKVDPKANQPVSLVANGLIHDF